ncbi:Hypothetical predicted protein [Mytilus galloprovincialis]|uniref:Endonuclease/exonuclease/phosphatase domain-containing protein n=1 Tax=Mytilus galloprovincialis TaxID=29158 RepID=A0A8B6GR43_MYTGA|nr:Hypothetical predicted protein [Mytilus galloprovincialis]
MTLEITTNRYGARPVRTHQAGAVPGSLSRRNPSNATGGTFVSSCGVRGRTRRATGRKNTKPKLKEQPVINIMHWNAEGASYKRDELQHFLHENNVNICCIQETHLQKENLQSQSWGYNTIDWQDEHHLIPVNDPTDTPTFYSRRWHTTTTPDLAFCTDDIYQNISRKDTIKLWNLTKALNDEGSKGQKITLEVEGKTITGKAAANAFAKGYEEVRNTNIPTSRKKEIRTEVREGKKTPAHEIMQTDITMSEMKQSIRKLKKKKSPGPDKTTNDMLQHLGNSSLNTLLDIFNLSWRQGKVPQCWKEAKMMPILKKGKN